MNKKSLGIFIIFLVLACAFTYMYRDKAHSFAATVLFAIITAGGCIYGPDLYKKIKHLRSKHVKDKA